MNNIYLMGRAFTEPELRHTASGVAMLRFTMVVDRRYTRAQKEQMLKDGKQTCDFIRIVAWGSVAENADRYLSKGGRLLLNGTLAIGRYDKEGGEIGYFTEVQADRIQIIDYPQRKLEQQTEEELVHETLILENEDEQSFETLESKALEAESEARLEGQLYEA